jgi:hypothetical protein
MTHDAPAHDAPARRAGDPLFNVRTADIEPYTGLRYLSKLFRLIAIVLVLMLVAEVVTGVVRQGAASLPTLVSEASRLIVLAGLLWGVGDMAVLLVDVGHDVRAVRILLGRQAVHAPPERHAPERPVIDRQVVERATADAVVRADAPATPPPNERRA